MPYKLQGKGKGFVVVDDTGKEYSDKPVPKFIAARQMKALYAAESGKKKELSLSDQDWKIRKAFMDEYCQNDTTGPMMPMGEKEQMWVTQVYADHLIFTKEDRFYTLDYAQSKDGVTFGAEAQEVEPSWKLVPASKERKSPRSFSVYKESNGEWRWFLYSGSAFRDRDGEIVKAKALIGAVDRIDARGDADYGPLRWWHIGGWEYPDGVEKWETWKAGPGIDLGRCDFSMVIGNMLLESGTFKTPEIGEAMAEVKELLGGSICFSHPIGEPVNKEYDNINLLERSLLPEPFASNMLTKLLVTKENDMDLKKKLGALSAILKGKPELAQQLLADADVIEKAAKDAGLEFKEVSEMIAPPGTVVDALEAVMTEAGAAAETTPVEEYIGDWSPSKLQETIAAAIADALKGEKEAAATKEASTIGALNDAIKALSALTGRIETVETTAKSTQQKLDELTDARPPKIKEIMQKRPTEKEENITSTPPAGPQIDPGFLDFARGGK
jgi:hypothetical protein